MGRDPTVLTLHDIGAIQQRAVYHLGADLAKVDDKLASHRLYGIPFALVAQLEPAQVVLHQNCHHAIVSPRDNKL